jgi:hypothetical protein
LAERLDVALLYMPAIFPEMHGDPIGAGFLSQQRSFHRIRDLDAAGLPNRRHVIDVDA